MFQKSRNHLMLQKNVKINKKKKKKVALKIHIGIKKHFSEKKNSICEI